MYSPRQLLDSLSLRQRFLLGPLLALVLIIVLTGTYVGSYRSHSRETGVLLVSELRQLGEIEDQFAALARAHLGLFNLLHDSSLQMAEEVLYEQAIQHMDKVRLANATLRALLQNGGAAEALAPSERTGPTELADLDKPPVQPDASALLNPSEFSERHRRILEEVDSYYATAASAVELTTLNVNFATRELIRANRQFVVLSQAFDQFSDEERAAISRSAQDSLKRAEGTGYLLAAVGTATAVGLLLLSWLFVNFLSRDLDRQIVTLRQLVGSIDADHAQDTLRNPVSTLAVVIDGFAYVISRLKQNEADMAALNQRLARSNQVLEQRVAERTVTLKDTNANLEEMNARLAAQAVELQQSEQRASKLLDMMPEAVWLQQGETFVYANEATLKLFGARVEADLLGTRLIARIAPDHQERVYGWIVDVFDEPQLTSSGQTELLRLDGSTVPVEMAGALVTFQNIPCVMMVCRDISERKRHLAEVEYLATHDALTHLPNRVLFQDRVLQAIGRAERRDHQLAVLFIDLDRFKLVNDTMGHAVGDQLLIAVARLLLTCVRDSDTVARFGGDEFVLLMEDMISESSPTALAKRIIDTVAEPIGLADHTVTIGCSIGISLFPEDGDDPDALLRHADIAMYRAKESGRNTFQFFTKEMQERLRAHVAMEKQLQQALEREEFVLHYQPQIDLKTGRMVCMEALIRWQSPEHGLVPPARFIGIAETSNLILAIGEWVIRKACRQLRSWRDQGLPVVPIAINVSAAQFERQDVKTTVQAALEASQLEPDLIELELTESLSMADPERSIVLMQDLKNLGVSIAIDDFGTGYSNLTYLKQFPVDKLKIDRAFVAGVLEDSNDRAIVSAIIQLAQSLGLRVIAEGVETEGQVQALLAAGCDALQGFYFCKPKHADELIELIGKPDLFDLSQHRERAHQRTLLLIDDQELIRNMITQSLANLPIQVVATGCAESAYELLAQHAVDVIIADHMLPGEDGINFLSKIRRLHPDITRILLTAHDTPQNLARAINQGAVYKFIAKPIDRQQLVETVEQAFRQHER